MHKAVKNLTHVVKKSKIATEAELPLFHVPSNAGCVSELQAWKNISPMKEGMVQSMKEEMKNSED